MTLDYSNSDRPPCPDDLHALDLLGIGAREDSYTNLLVAACRYFPSVQTQLAKHAGISKPSRSWYAQQRVGITHKVDSLKRRNVPDVVLTSTSPPALIIVENKIFSGEGYEQLKRYKDEAAPELAKKLLAASAYDTGFVYLTLDDEPPADEPQADDGWTRLSWRHAVSWVRAALATGPSDNPVLDQLLRELVDRIGWRTSLAPPEDWTLERWLNSSGWSSIVDRVTRADALRTLSLFPGMDHDWSGKIDIPGKEAGVPLLGAERDGWKSKTSITSDTQDEESGRANFSVSFKLTFPRDGPRLELNHGPNPWERRKQLKARAAVYAGVKQRRDAFLAAIDELSKDAPGWAKPRRRDWVNALEYEGLSYEQTVGEFRDTVKTAVKRITPAVDQALGQVERQFDDVR